MIHTVIMAEDERAETDTYDRKKYSACQFPFPCNYKQYDQYEGWYKMHKKGKYLSTQALSFLKGIKGEHAYE